MPTTPCIFGAPLSLRAPRFLAALLLCGLCGALRADGPLVPASNELESARVSLLGGGPSALADAARALKAQPLGAAENLHAALALFNAGQFEDAARHLRRALSASPDMLGAEPPLATRMGAAAIARRLEELAPGAAKDTELCFLSGAICLLNTDMPRALPLLIRAEELAGTDAQASRAAARDGKAAFMDRARERGTAALRLGRYDEGARNFAFAALDTPTCAEHYAGAAVALALAGERRTALRLLDLALARATYARLCAWLRDLRLAPGRAQAATAAVREPAIKTATLADLRLAACVAMSAGMFNTAREALIAALALDKLDLLGVSMLTFMDEHRLVGDPPGTAEPPANPPDPEKPAPAEPAPAQDATPPMEQARGHIRRLEFAEALKVLDPLARAEQKDNNVFLLVFVASIGHKELQQGADALQAWFARVDDAERTRQNSIRELFDRAEQFAQWRKIVLDVRTADPTAALPRLLNAFIELSTGAFTAARAETQLALIGEPGNGMLKAMQRILQGPAFQEDKAAPQLGDKPAPRALMTRADALFRKGDYEDARTELLVALEASPREPELAGQLLRVYFALGDYARAARQAEALLAEQDIAARAASDFKYLIESGYDSRDEFSKHLAALSKAAAERTSAADEYLLLGVIQFARTQWREAANALNEWKGLSRDKVLNVAVLKLLEAANKNA